MASIIIFVFLNRFIDVKCLPNFCEDGMIPWPGYPNECFEVNKEVCEIYFYIILFVITISVSGQLRILPLDEDWG